MPSTWTTTRSLLNRTALQAKPLVAKVDIVINQMLIDGRNGHAVDLVRQHPTLLEHLGDGLTRDAKGHLFTDEALIDNDRGKSPVLQQRRTTTHVITKQGYSY